MESKRPSVHSTFVRKFTKSASVHFIRAATAAASTQNVRPKEQFDPSSSSHTVKLKDSFRLCLQLTLNFALLNGQQRKVVRPSGIACEKTPCKKEPQVITGDTEAADEFKPVDVAHLLAKGPSQY